MAKIRLDVVEIGFLVLAIALLVMAGLYQLGVILK